MEKNNLLVSVIVPTYNRAKRLERAVWSVCRQTYKRLEIVVVDDASSDNTKEVVESFHDDRIVYLRHKTNRGGAAARNTGIRASTGDVIAFLDDDDEWVPEKTNEHLDILKTHDVAVCTSAGTTDELTRRNPKTTVELDDLRQGPWGGTGVLMAKADVIRDTMFDESLPRGQDWDLFIRIALKHEIAYLDKQLLLYDGGNHPRITNSVRNKSIAELEQQFRVVHKHKDLFGQSWFNRHMSRGLLFGFKDRKDKLALLRYTARRYGVMNVARALANRIKMKILNKGVGRSR